MASIDKQYERLLKTKAKVFDKIAKMKPVSNGEVMKSAHNLLYWYEHDPEAFFGAMIAAIDKLENAHAQELVGLRRRYQTYNRRRSPGSNKQSPKRTRRASNEDEVSPARTDAEFVTNYNGGGTDDLG